MVLDQKLRAYILSTSWRESEAGPHAGFWNLKAYSTDTPLQTKLYLLRHPKIVLPTSYSSIQTYEITGTILIQTSTLLFFFILLFAITNYMSAWEQVFIETRVGYPGARVTDNYKLPDLSARGGGGGAGELGSSERVIFPSNIPPSLSPWENPNPGFLVTFDMKNEVPGTQWKYSLGSNLPICLYHDSIWAVFCLFVSIFDLDTC